MLQQQPIVAAPAASPDKFKIIPIAAELIGNVKNIPISTDTTIPIINGCCSVPQFTNIPRLFIKLEIPGPINKPAIEPVPMVTTGATKISTLVFPATTCPQVIPTSAATKAPKGSPGPT